MAPNFRRRDRHQLGFQAGNAVPWGPILAYAKPLTHKFAWVDDFQGLALASR